MATYGGTWRRKGARRADSGPLPCHGAGKYVIFVIQKNVITLKAEALLSHSIYKPTCIASILLVAALHFPLSVPPATNEFLLSK